MSKPSANTQGNFAGPHPLALRLLQELPVGGTVLEIGPGSGRNSRALRAAGVNVIAVEPQPSAFAGLLERKFGAVLSTHAMLHGTPPTIEALLRRAQHHMNPGARLYATFGCVRDSRYGQGRKLSAHAYAPEEGDEAGVPHSFFEEADIRELSGALRIVTLEETNVDDVTGKWAHTTAPLSGAVHWFAVLEK